jgi:hypothetical protein
MIVLGEIVAALFEIVAEAAFLLMPWHGRDKRKDTQ